MQRLDLKIEYDTPKPKKDEATEKYLKRAKKIMSQHPELHKSLAVEPVDN